jgi:protein-S-isoprenylcysteine O-methyltransferase Ste14
MAAIYWRAIRIEEAKFSASPVSSEYRAYKARTGMLLPVRLSRHSAGAA